MPAAPPGQQPWQEPQERVAAGVVFYLLVS